MNGDDERLVNKQVDAFIGVSSTQGWCRTRSRSSSWQWNGRPSLRPEPAMRGGMFHAAIEIVPEEHNQWIRTFRVIITPDK